MQAEERDHMLGGLVDQGVVVRMDLRRHMRSRRGRQGDNVALDEFYAARGNQLAHRGDRRGRTAELCAPVHEGQRAHLVGERDGPVERRVAAAADHEVLAVEVRGGLDPVQHLLALEPLDVRHAEAARLEGADAGGNDDRARVEHGARRGRHVEAAVVQLPDFGDFLAEMIRRVEGLRLFDQAIDEFLCAADGQRRNVVDRLVRVQLGTLPAGLRQRIDDVRRDAEEAEFEDLEQARGAGANDDCFCVDGVAHGA